MWSLLASLGMKAWGKIAGGVGILLALVTVYFKGKNAAREEIREETVKTVIETHEKVRENEKEIRDLGGVDDPERKRLRGKYNRD